MLEAVTESKKYTWNIKDASEECEMPKGDDQLPKGYDETPKGYPLTKFGMLGLDLLHRFYAALHDDQLPGFLKSDDLESFLHDMRTAGPFGGKLGDGGPGSKIPGIGTMDPLDVLHELLTGVGADLGRVDHPDGGVDPASGAGDMDGCYHRDRPSDRMISGIIDQHPNESMTRTTFFREGGSETWSYSQVDINGTSVSHVIVDPDGSTYKSVITPDGQGGFWQEESTSGGAHEITVSSHYFGPGGYRSPGEDGGGDTNSGRNPLGNIDVLGPQSMQQTLAAMQHPDKDPELDPNSGIGAFTMSQSEQERLGRIAPAMEVLDPNSGMDPLSQLNLDPNQLHGRSEKDDRIDPNTGLTAFPVGGPRPASLAGNTKTKTNNES
jgi:hypothetical protein